MSGAEVIAVVACVAAVVSAYNDGSRILTAIRNKWHDRRRQTDHSTRDLEWSLARGHHEILSQYKEYHQEIGRRYEEGDSLAREQMKDIIITLQGALLRHLREAQEKGVNLDLMALQIESDQGRVRTLVVLGDLFQRLARSSAMLPSISMSIDPTYQKGEPYGRGYRSPPDGLLDTRYPSSGLYGSSGGVIGSICTSPIESLASTRDFEMSSPVSSSPRRRSSGIGSVVSSVSDMFHSRPGRGSTSSVPSSIPESGFISGPMQTASPTDPIPEFGLRPATPPHKRSTWAPDLIPHDEIWGNPWQHELNTDSDDDLSKHFQQTHLSPVSAPIVRRHSLPPPSIASTDSTPSNPSTYSDTTRAARLLWPPSKANNYLGFCKGAWKVHSGFAGFKIHSEPGSGYYTQRSWLRCKECAFEAPMTKSSSSNPHFDETIRTHQATGVRYRSEFLAKSHVPCKRDSTSVFSPLIPRGAFCCVFCCAHQGSTQVYGNLDTFLTHLADSHCAVDRETLAILPSTRCVVGRMAGDSEYFDVNIPPR
ncbi:unnamed protein product [Penicillium salamii]|uniref:Uncharacterized protein n=1 Tax=Penicillium salamii TaxID=1612424 RepID=A0A9W4NEI1_9EURO|nr:unnamed protein product [Penicillium salamii]CAG8356455.1 unnamed protein product [Penicillium salamii]CAG8368923.1 unnamed protein product [Penicillium salamii]CAG8394208.1 unnamed protein product [Penicillium salamii]